MPRRGGGRRNHEFEGGRTSMPLPELLSLLGKHGIRRLPLEWDGWE